MALNNFDLMSVADKNDQEAERIHQQRLNSSFDISSRSLGLAGSIVGLILPRIGNILHTASDGVALGGSVGRMVDNATRSGRTPHLPSLNSRKNGN